jgi:cellulose synthase/poly-beta-1,6-N-acetylglucosamine synthase-like glycosyltransferase
MARRKAVKKSKAPILIFIDADISLKNDAIEELLKPFQNETVGIVTGLLKGKGETIVAKSYGNLREIFYKLRGDKNNFDWAPGGFFAIRRNVLDSVGGYEVKKRGSGDLDLSWKVKKKGYTVFFNEKAQAYHADPNTISKIWKREKRIGFMEYKLTRYHLKEIFKIRRLLRFYPLVMIVLIPFLILYAWQIFLVLILTSYILTICIVKGSIKVRSIAWFIFNVMNLAYVSGFISSILHRSGD